MEHGCGVSANRTRHINSMKTDALTSAASHSASVAPRESATHVSACRRLRAASTSIRALRGARTLCSSSRSPSTLSLNAKSAALLCSSANVWSTRSWMEAGSWRRSFCSDPGDVAPNGLDGGQRFEVDLRHPVAAAAHAGRDERSRERKHNHNLVADALDQPLLRVLLDERHATRPRAL